MKHLILLSLFVSSSVLATEIPAQSALDKMKQEYLIQVEKNKIMSEKAMNQLDNLIKKNQHDLDVLSSQGIVTQTKYYHVKIVQDKKTNKGVIYVRN